MARKISKNLAKARALVEPRPYVLADAVPLLQKAKYAKFDETVDLTLRLGVDLRGEEVHAGFFSDVAVAVEELNG